MKAPSSSKVSCAVSSVKSKARGCSMLQGYPNKVSVVTRSASPLPRRSKVGSSTPAGMWSYGSGTAIEEPFQSCCFVLPNLRGLEPFSDSLFACGTDGSGLSLDKDVNQVPIFVASKPATNHTSMPLEAIAFMLCCKVRAKIRQKQNQNANKSPKKPKQNLRKKEKTRKAQQKTFNQINQKITSAARTKS